MAEEIKELKNINEKIQFIDEVLENLWKNVYRKNAGDMAESEGRDRKSAYPNVGKEFENKLFRYEDIVFGILDPRLPSKYDINLKTISEVESVVVGIDVKFNLDNLNDKYIEKYSPKSISDMLERQSPNLTPNSVKGGNARYPPGASSDETVLLLYVLPTENINDTSEKYAKIIRKAFINVPGHTIAQIRRYVKELKQNPGYYTKSSKK